MKEDKGLRAAASADGDDSRKSYTMHEKLGEGSHGTVWGGIEQPGGVSVAIKVIRDIIGNKLIAKQAIREIKALRLLQHQNVVKLRNIFWSRNQELCIVMERVETDLDQVLESGQSLSPEHAKFFIYQVLCGLKYMHSANIVHRDLKPANLVVTTTCQLKICDFGLARLLCPPEEEGASKAASANPPVASPVLHTMTDYVASRWYRAPEVILSRQQGDYSCAIDMWAAGCILAEIILGVPVFKTDDSTSLLHRILYLTGTPQPTASMASVIASAPATAATTYSTVGCEGRDGGDETVVEHGGAGATCSSRQRAPLLDLFPSHVDPEAQDLILKLLEFDPARRLTVAQALSHPYLSDLHLASEEPVISDLDSTNVRENFFFDIPSGPNPSSPPRLSPHPSSSSVLPHPPTPPPNPPPPAPPLVFSIFPVQDVFGQTQASPWCKGGWWVGGACTLIATTSRLCRTD